MFNNCMRQTAMVLGAIVAVSQFGGIPVSASPGASDENIAADNLYAASSSEQMESSSSGSLDGESEETEYPLLVCLTPNGSLTIEDDRGEEIVLTKDEQGNVFETVDDVTTETAYEDLENEAYWVKSYPKGTELTITADAAENYVLSAFEAYVKPSETDANGDQPQNTGLQDNSSETEMPKEYDNGDTADCEKSDTSEETAGSESSSKTIRIDQQYEVDAYFVSKNDYETAASSSIRRASRRAPLRTAAETSVPAVTSVTKTGNSALHGYGRLGGGWTTNLFYIRDSNNYQTEYGYCGDPSRATPANITYDSSNARLYTFTADHSTASVNAGGIENTLACILYYGYGGPGGDYINSTFIPKSDSGTYGTEIGAGYQSGRKYGSLNQYEEIALTHVAVSHTLWANNSTYGFDVSKGSVLTGFGDAALLQAYIESSRRLGLPEGVTANITVVNPNNAGFQTLIYAHFTDTPSTEADPASVSIIKKDSSDGTPIPNTSFRFEYTPDSDAVSDGYKDARTWILKTDSAGIALLNNDHKVSGDDFYLHNNLPIVPTGTLKITEIKAAPGYTMDGSVIAVTESGQTSKTSGTSISLTIVKGDNANTFIQYQNSKLKDGNLTVEDNPVPPNGDLKFRKVDREECPHDIGVGGAVGSDGTGHAEGSATLEGAVYGVFQGSDQMFTMTTDANG